MRNRCATKEFESGDGGASSSQAHQRCVGDLCAAIKVESGDGGASCANLAPVHPMAPKEGAFCYNSSLTTTSRYIIGAIVGPHGFFLSTERHRQVDPKAITYSCLSIGLEPSIFQLLLSFRICFSYLYEDSTSLSL